MKKTIQARRRTAAVKPFVTECECPPLEELLAKAKEEPMKRPLVVAQDFVPAAHALRQRNYRWVEIAHWLRERGVPISWSAIRTAYYRIHGPETRARTSTRGGSHGRGT